MSSGGTPNSVAVVIPVWDDYVGLLLEAVESVVTQGVAEQVVVVDNASDVPVPELDGTTIVRASRRLSTGAARNLGLEAVRTPFVVFLDADDVMLPGSLEELVAGISGDGAVSAYCLSLVDGDTGQRHRSPRWPARALSRYRRTFALANSVWSLLPTQGATITRVDVARSCGGYAERSQGEDWAFGVSLAWRGRICFGDSPALVYRSRPDSPGRAEASPPLLANARCVRQRLRAEGAAVRFLVPLVAMAQGAAILALRPVFLLVRAAGRILRDHRPASRRA